MTEQTKEYMFAEFELLSDIEDSDYDSENDPIIPIKEPVVLNVELSGSESGSDNVSAPINKREEYSNLINMIKEIIKVNIKEIKDESFTMKSLKRELLSRGIEKKYYTEQKEKIKKRLPKLIEQSEKSIEKDIKKVEREKAKKIRDYKKANADRMKRIFGKTKKPRKLNTGLRLS